jgi:RNA polymerase sigma factor (sigma-70 family)
VPIRENRADCNASGCSSTAFDQFFRLNYARTVQLAHLFTGSNVAAEDLAQEAFRRVYPHYGDLREPNAYLRAVTVNVCRTWHRSRSREADRLRRHGTSPTEIEVEHDELLDTIRTLSYRGQAVLVLRYWLDLSEADIAASLGCRKGTVKSIHARALESIRRELGDATS